MNMFHVRVIVFCFKTIEDPSQGSPRQEFWDFFLQNDYIILCVVVKSHSVLAFLHF